MLEEKIKQIESRFQFSMSSVSGVKTVSVGFPNNWVIEIPEDNEVQCYPENGIFNFWSENSDYSNIIDVVLEVLQYNLELQEKEVLFNEKYIELVSLFKEKNLSTLKTLSFVFGEKKKQPKPDFSQKENNSEKK